MRQSFWYCKVFLLVLIVISFGAAYFKMVSIPARTPFAPPSVESSVATKPMFNSRFVSSAKTRMVHSPSIVELGRGRLSAFWFAGTREGAKDVEIHSAQFQPESQSWTPEQTVITRSDTYSDTQRYVKKLGNPVVTRDPRGKLWLFFVSVSFGGWSCSSINVSTSDDDGLHWSPIRKMITSPFLNISSLVKTVPFYYRDGTMGLPVYHEMVAKYGELLRLDHSGRVIDKTRLNSAWRALQPLVLVKSSEKAVAYMRYSGAKAPRLALKTLTDDAGRHWSLAEQSALPNPDSAMAGVSLNATRRLLVINNNQQLRDDLTLFQTRDDGQHWLEVYRFEHEHRYRGHTFTEGEFRHAIHRLIGKTDSDFVASESLVSAIERIMCTGHPCWFQFEYPYLIRANDGNFHLVYTWNQTFIKHVEFNQAWLDRQAPRGS